jgi:small-conductance mechanosensitive channel
MDNSVKSNIRRALKVTIDYFVNVVIFVIFLSVVINVAKNNLQTGVFIFSIIIFLIMFSMIYTNMSEIAFKEKRPQYGLHPSPYKGFLYGVIGLVPVFLLQLLNYAIPYGEELLTLQFRVLQGITGPLYWIASLISDESWAYHLVLLVIPVAAGLGYLAGHREFYIMRKLKIFDKKKKNIKPPTK